ncbi:DAPG hydrolase family protein [Streptomyces sp. NPDC086787]|uniref:DAPG hydrolase family protein n=1 Tax=Streptomyces sp. NPDC086787 TaxID=3365759 RepID=UPI0038124D07
MTQHARQRHQPQRHGTPYLGYRTEDTGTPFASYFDPDMAPLAPHVVAAVNAGPQAGPLLTALEDAGSLLDKEGEATETGYALLPDGSMRVAVLTPMPQVAPAMWDWWFSWHGDDTRKYKLWHPRAHAFAQWADDGAHPGPRAYVGRTSFVDEYLGSRFTRAAIRFIPPSELGLDEASLADPEQATAICARIGLSNRPLDAGYLLHHVRRVPGGAEMRSRFWVGGRHAALRGRGRTTSRPVPALVGRAAAMTARQAVDLMVHCAQEMAHLASFLPALHEQFGD